MNTDIKDNEKESRFETIVENHSAFILYKKENNTLFILSTVVPSPIGGKGIAGELTRYALAYARKNKLKVNPICTYTKAFIDKYSEYSDLKIQ